MAGHDPMDNRQPHPAPFPNRLGGKKRFEDSLPCLRRHAIAAIAHRQSQVRSRLQPSPGQIRILIHLDPFETDFQDSTFSCMAWNALTQRFMSTCCICTGLAKHGRDPVIDIEVPQLDEVIDI